MNTNNVLQSEANDGTTGASAGGTAQATQTKPAATSSQSSGSVLSQGTTTTNTTDWLPEKYQVKNAEGVLDVEASARKVAEAHKALEQRMGAGEAPPKTAEEYAPKLEVEGFNFDEFKADPASQTFLKAAHAKGINNDQLSFILGEYYQRVPELVAGAQALDSQTATAELRKEWISDAEFKQNINNAFKAFNGYSTEAEKAQIDAIGNNPLVIRILARIGKEMGEDSPVRGDGVHEADFATQASELRKQLETLKPNDPMRKKVSEQLQNLYAKKFGNKPQVLGGGANIKTV